MSNRYSEIQSSDFSGRILSDSTEDDINKLEVYKLKEKLKARNPESTLADMDDIAFCVTLLWLSLTAVILN